MPHLILEGPLQTSLSHLEIGSSAARFSNCGDSLLLPSLFLLGIGSSATSFSNFGDSLLLPSLSRLGIGYSITNFSNFGNSLLLPSLSRLVIGYSAMSFFNFRDSLLLSSISHLGLGTFAASFSSLRRSLSTIFTTFDFSPTSSSAPHINEREGFLNTQAGSDDKGLGVKRLGNDHAASVDMWTSVIHVAYHVVPRGMWERNMFQLI
ncbi:hypothetical protein Adt_09273 [Abeliophyllum distichum]|uniref:Uncharacterized protein n=1 Tax=Abeliophyllum distichum TaxID=126358 RepID=A0ABD1UGQ1_9LAMI